MTELVYSRDGECYSFHDLDECIQEYVADWSANEIKIGEIGSVWQAEPERPDIDKYIPSNIVEMIRDNFYNDFGDWCDDYLDDHEEGIYEAVQKAIVAYCDEHNCHPNFYLAKNVKEVKFRITGCDTTGEIFWERGEIECQI